MFDNKRKSEIGPVKGREIKRYERYLETKAGIEYKNQKIYISKWENKRTLIIFGQKLKKQPRLNVLYWRVKNPWKIRARIIRNKIYLRYH